MPTYDYKCDACGNTFEKFQSMTAAPIRRCPKCGKNKVRRLNGTGAGLIFKGSGFYITDYRDKSYTERAKAESGTGSSSESKSGQSEGGKESSKPETKSENKPTAPAKSETAASKSEKKPAKKK
jgi:putative FmdB family regulatory protein